MTSDANDNPTGNDGTGDSSDVGEIRKDNSLSQADQVDYLANQVVSDGSPAIETVVGNLGLEDSPSDHPSGDQLRGR